jgi:hypothetical protein|tara:strand:+ start:1997 stop:2230 length:234 start_codon:yes stop_codon:yes gene_type:complete
METNPAIRVYNTILNIADTIREKDDDKELPKNGLLSPRGKMSNEEPEQVEDSPAYRVALYFNQIREKRELLKNGRNR